MKFKPNLLRNLAQSYNWQILYTRSKEIACIKLFDNGTDLSQLQIHFLQWLEIYYSLEMDLALKEVYLNKDGIKDEIRTDAYLLWKTKEKDKKSDKKQEKGIDSTSGISSVIFKGRKK